MALDADAEVFQMHGVQDAQGLDQPPASDAYGFKSGADIDINNGGNGIHVEPYVPGRPSRVVVHVEATAAFTVTLNFEDDAGTILTSRHSGDNPDYSSDGTTDVYVSAVPSSPFLSIDITDTSGGANTADYTILVI